MFASGDDSWRYYAHMAGHQRAVKPEASIIIGVVGAEGKEFKDVASLPNTRTIDVLNQLNLAGFKLAKPEGSA
jgi:hypothetical protein